MNESRQRNQPCACGSGKKFKKCCWEPSKMVLSKMSPPVAPVVASPLSNESGMHIAVASNTTLKGDLIRRARYASSDAR